MVHLTTKLAHTSGEWTSSESAGSSRDAPEHPISVTGPQVVPPASRDPPSVARIHTSILSVDAPRRYRNREHLRYVAKQPCLVCGRKPSDPHHLRYLQPRALGRRASNNGRKKDCLTQSPWISSRGSQIHLLGFLGR